MAIIIDRLHPTQLTLRKIEVNEIKEQGLLPWRQGEGSTPLGSPHSDGGRTRQATLF